jgi:hypothetical protein
MISIMRLVDLEQFGVYPLTGESDRLGYRCLCDLDSRGVELMALALGLQVPAPTEGKTPAGWLDNWNGGSDEWPHIASVMLAYDAWTWIAPVALHKAGQHHTAFLSVSSDGTDQPLGVWGLEPDEEIRWTEDEGVDDPFCGHYELKRAKMDWQRWPICYGVIRKLYYSASKTNKAPGNGTRNAHVMSGRVY